MSLMEITLGMESTVMAFPPNELQMKSICHLSSAKWKFLDCLTQMTTFSSPCDI